MNRIIRIITDILASICLVLFVASFVASLTIIRPAFYSNYYRNVEITEKIEQRINENHESIAKDTGIEIDALQYAIDKKTDINALKMQIPISVLNGVNADYRISNDIDESYRSGIEEYYALSGLKIDENALNECVDKASDSFNKAMCTPSINELSKTVLRATYSMKICASVSIVLLILLVFRIFSLNHGRTKTFAHLASVVNCAGFGMIAIFLSNIVFNYMVRLSLTKDDIIEGAIEYAVGKYFTILAIIGCALIVAGFIASRFVYEYYMDKNAYRLQEKMINQKVRDDAQRVSESTQNIENGED